MPFYIQRKQGKELETVDGTNTRKEANFLVSEYTLSDHSADYYVSTRPCNNWKD